MPELRLVDPVEHALPGETAAGPGLGSLRGTRIALLENTKPGGAQLFARVGDELRRRWDCEVELLSKPDTTVVPDAIFRDLSARFRGIVTGLGD